MIRVLTVSVSFCPPWFKNKHHNERLIGVNLNTLKKTPEFNTFLFKGLGYKFVQAECGTTLAVEFRVVNIL